MIGLSVAAMVVASVLRKRLAARYSGWTAALTGIASYLVAMIVVVSLLPTINEVPAAFPAGCFS